MSNMSKAIALAVVGLAYLVAYPVQASDQSIRCGSYIIYAGGKSDSALMYEVLRKCGEPKERLGNTWIYEQGSMVRILTFGGYDGRLYRIESRRK